MKDKLSKEDIQFIKENYKPWDKELGAHALAERFGVHYSTISAIARRASGPKPGTIEYYIAQKIKMLKREFYIELTVEEIKHFKSLKSEKDVNRYAHDILKNKL